MQPNVQNDVKLFAPSLVEKQIKETFSNHLGTPFRSSSMYSVSTKHIVGPQGLQYIRCVDKCLFGGKNFGLAFRHSYPTRALDFKKAQG